MKRWSLPLVTARRALAAAKSIAVAVAAAVVPLPSSSVPGSSEWLKSIGIVVHNVDPNSPAAQVLDAP